MMERSYFLAHGESEKKVREFFAKRGEAFTQANAIAKEVGGDRPAVGHRISGITFKAVPHGWTEKGRTGDGIPYYLPLRKSKAGKELASRIEAVRIPGAVDLHSEFTRDGGHLSSEGLGITINYISAQIIGGKAVITVPNGMDFVPPDCTPLKTSEYWALKEALPLHEGSGS